MQTLRWQQDFSAPRERVFAYLAEHENLNTVFAPMKIERLNDGPDDRNGVGSRRKLSLGGLLPFEETVTAVVPNERIEYRITKGSPLRGHRGVMSFSDTPAGGTHLDYTISFDTAVPGLGRIIGPVLKQRVTAGLAKVAPRV